MKNPGQQNLRTVHPTPLITPARIATIRVINDLVITLITLYFTIPAFELDFGKAIFIIVAGIFLGSLLGWFLIRRGNTILGMGFVIYGLILGLPVVSIFVEGLGPFTLVSLILITALSVSYGVPSRRVIEAMTASVLAGAASMVFDLRFREAEFRLPTPATLPSLLWIVTFLLAGTILYLIYRQFSFFPLRAKLITSFALVTIISLALLGFLNSQSVNEILTQEANQSLYIAASQTTGSLRTFINTQLQNLKTEAKLPALIEYLSFSETEREGKYDQTLKTLQALAARDSQIIASYALIDLNGDVILDTQAENIGANESTLSAFTDPINSGKPVMSEVLLAPGSDEPSIYFSAPVVENSQIIVGVLRVRYRASVLQSLVASHNDRGGQGSYGALFDENLIHLAHGTAPETIFTSVMPLPAGKFQQLIEARRLPNQTEAETFLDLPDLESNLRLVQDSPNSIIYFDAQDIVTEDMIDRVVVINLGTPPWLLAFFQPKSIFLAPTETLANNTILLSLLSAVGAVVVAIVLTQVLVSPITKLNQTAQEIAKGNLRSVVEITTEDEIGTLGNTFNQMSTQLQNLVGNLESQVAERTRRLENRAAQLQAAAEVARDVTSEEEPHSLLVRAAALIQDRFGFYHVGVYLQDANKEYAVLTAADTHQGQQLLDNGHKVKISIDSNVGFVCLIGEPRIASRDNPAQPTDYHPVNPNTQAQLLLPLKIANATIGVIDIHSTNPQAFAEDEISIFHTLADQIAISIQKAEFREEMQRTLHELEAAYGQFTREAWRKFIQDKKETSGYRFKQRQIETVQTPTPEVVQAWQDGKTVQRLHTSEETGQATSLLAIPMKVRGEVIGVLNLEFDAQQIPADTSKLVEEIANRLSLILENARLVESAEKQVEREQLTNQFSNLIRQSLDMEVVIRTAVQEIGESLGLPEVEVRLGSIDAIQRKPVKSNGNAKQPSASDSK